MRRRGWDPSQKVAGPVEGQVDQCDYFFFNVVKEDIKCIEISSIDAVHNRTMTLAYELKGVNDAARGR